MFSVVAWNLIQPFDFGRRMKVENQAVSGIHCCNCLHFFFGQTKVHDFEILCHAFLVDRFRNCDNSALQMPAKNDLRRALSILFSQVKEGSIPFSVNFAPMIDKSCFNSDFLTTLCLCVAFCMLSACHRQDDGKVEACAFQDEHNSTWGLVNTDGTILMPAGSFSRQPSAVVGGMFTLPNKEGQFSLYATSHPAKPVTPRTFFRSGHFFSQVTLAQESSNGPVLIVDKAGKDIASTAQYPQYDIVRMHNFSDGMALFVTGQGKYGYINTKGHVTVPPLYDVAYDFHEGIALVGMNNSQGKTGYQLINTDGQVTGNISLAGCLLDVCFSDKRLLFKNLDRDRFRSDLL